MSTCTFRDSSSTSVAADPLTKRQDRHALLSRVTMHWTVFLLCNCLGMLLWIRLFEQADLPWQHTVNEAIVRLTPFAIISSVILPPFVLDTIKLSRRLTTSRPEQPTPSSHQPLETNTRSGS